MARRRKKADFGEGLITLVVIGTVLSAVHNSLPKGSGAALASFILIVVIGAAVFACARFILRLISEALARRRRDDAQRRLLQKVQIAIKQHSASLIRRRAQLVQNDAYGNPKLEQWVKEVHYFIAKSIKGTLTPDEQIQLTENSAAISALIDQSVKVATVEQPSSPNFSERMKPAEFEAFCAEVLRMAGWDARVTMQSRDQGVDVVAEKNGWRVVLQCKLYARPVGNKAVQEAAAARSHEQAHYAVVVTNNKYTLSAEQLASTNAVLLLHYRDLSNLEQILLDCRGGEGCL